MTVHIDQARQSRKVENFDQDETETGDWLGSLASLYRNAGADRVRFVLSALDRRAKELGVISEAPPYSPYRNSIPLESQVPFPGDLDMEARVTAIIRWNAMAMVMRANKTYGELGGTWRAMRRPQRYLK